MSKNKNFKLEIVNKPNPSVEEALGIAANFTRKRSVWIWIQSNFFIRRKYRKYYYLCYSYLRWVDDYVDNPGRDKQLKIEFVESQLKLIDDLLNNKNIDLENLFGKFKFSQEFFIYYLIKYAQETHKNNLIIDIKHVIESIWLDAKRLFVGGILSQNELNHYIALVSKPISNIINCFLFPKIKTFDEDKIVGVFLGYITALRDFYEDIEMGYINISKEDILKYNLNISDLKNDEKRLDWMADKYPELLNLFYEEISILKSMPVKAKLFWFFPYLVVYKMLTRIKIYDYNFGVKVKIKLWRELRVYSESLYVSFKTIAKIFF